MNRFQSWYGIQPPALRALLTINVVLYVLWILLFGRIGVTERFVLEHLALIPVVPDVLFEPWQLITYNFLHLSKDFWGFIHILFNMLWLVWIGREYEELHGAHRLMALYLIAGFGGGLMTVAFYVFFPSAVVVYGASASVLGVLTAVAVTYPYKSIALLFIGTVRLVYVVIAFLALDLLFNMGGGVAVMAHLGGALFGFLFAKAEMNGMDLSSWARVFFRQRQRDRRGPTRREEGMLRRVEAWRASRNAARGEQPKPRRAKIHPLRTSEAASTAADTTLESEVDRILDKISEEGYEALTEEEKRVLYEASRK